MSVNLIYFIGLLTTIQVLLQIKIALIWLLPTSELKVYTTVWISTKQILSLFVKKLVCGI